MINDLDNIVPRSRLYARHALALLDAFNFVLHHHDSLHFLIPERKGDDILNKRSEAALAAAIKAVEEEMLCIATDPALDNATYSANLREARQGAAYAPVRELEMIRKLRQQSAAAPDGADPDGVTTDWPQLWDQVCVLRRLLEESGRSPDDQVGSRFEKTKVGDNQVPRLADLEAAVRVFFNRLPPDEQRKITNGWRAERQYPHPDEVLDKTTTSVRQTVHLLAYPNEGGVVGFPEWDLCDDLDGVRVAILFGTSKEQALRELDLMRRLVAEKWEELIEGDDNDVKLEAPAAKSAPRAKPARRGKRAA